MLIAKKAGEIEKLKSGWIIEGAENVYLEFVRIFRWPAPRKVRNPLTKEIERVEIAGVFVKALVNEHQTVRVYTVDSDIELFDSPQVGLAADEWNPAHPVDREWLDYHAAALFHPNGTIDYYSGDNYDALGDALADALFDEDESVMTLTQFKAQSGYQKIACAYEYASKANDYLITT